MYAVGSKRAAGWRREVRFTVRQEKKNKLVSECEKNWRDKILHQREEFRLDNQVPLIINLNVND